jgi:quercetin dioxygenase-like cupin family protein
MIIVNTKGLKPPESQNDPMVDKGPVYRSLLVDGKTTHGYSIAIVSYSPGSKLNWHKHDMEQILYVTEGKGILATRQKENIVTPGMLVVIPAGEDHTHGATQDSTFTHIAFYSGRSEITARSA